MKKTCDLLDSCGFFKKYGATKELACKGFVQMYCRGPKMNDCMRKQFQLKNGVPPSDDMMPSGQMISS